MGEPKVKLSYRKCSYYGKYDPCKHKIIIYVCNIKTIGELSSTIIHEWTHSIQDVLGKYVALYKKFGYDNHPMEIEAYTNEEKYNRKCLNWIKKRYEL
jgi:hypothetical protein